MKYRAEVDGLRAIAVLSVIMYHAQFVLFGRDWFQGGYIGVDIFFVISGYLITKIILSELRETGSFDYAFFYERRARRILPMLFVVMLASFPFAWRFLLPGDFIEYSKSIVSAVFFGSNFFFYYATTSYGADSSLLKPFLHTWSLGIEEQFYIVLPLLVVFFYRFLNRHILLLFAVLLLLSLVGSAMLATSHPQLNFYFPLSRFWELLAGSILAYLELRRGRLDSRLASRILPALGIVLIAGAGTLFDDSTPHPGLLTALPVLGVALIIAASSPRDLIGRFLAWRPMVWIGLISYSAYLWHFPVFAFARISNDSPGHGDKIEWLLITFVLSAASYIAIERPFRKQSVMRRKTLIWILSATAAVIVALQVAALSTQGFIERLPSIFRADSFVQEPWMTLKNRQGNPCFDGGLCVFEAQPAGNDGKPGIFFLGDSHLAAVAKGLRERLADHDLYFDLLGGCPFYLGASRYESDGVANKCSAERQAERLETVMATDAEIVVIMGRYPLFLSGRWFDNQEGGVESTDYIEIRSEQGLSPADAVRQGIQHLLDAGKQLVLVYPLVEAGWNVPEKLNRERPEDLADLKQWLKENPVTVSFDAYRNRARETFEVFDSIDHPNIHRVYPHTLLCNTKIPHRCVTHDQDHIYYADDDHPTGKGSEMINDLIINKIRTIKDP
ncbi:MAG: acyltransferase family protein [Wenzhouxiangellaceae bacterium]